MTTQPTILKQRPDSCDIPVSVTCGHAASVDALCPTLDEGLIPPPTPALRAQAITDTFLGKTPDSQFAVLVSPESNGSPHPLPHELPHGLPHGMPIAKRASMQHGDSFDEHLQLDDTWASQLLV